MEGGKRKISDNGDDDIFSNYSIHHLKDIDEEALKWDAIQKLPTFSRLKKGLLTTPQGQANEVDILKLGLQEKRYLLETLVRNAEEDNCNFLLKLRDRFDRWNSIVIFFLLSLSLT